LTRADAEDLLFHEARLIDERRLDEWLRLFTDDGLYWIPIDESKPPSINTAIVYDDKLRREERVHHVLHNTFISQSPRSRTLHFVNNVAVEPGANGEFRVNSNQVIYEVRRGDFTQVGLGEVRPIVANVAYVVRPVDGALKIALKKVLLIDRDMSVGNLTFIV
jgi:ethylbenzene dioxygenase beta subunit